MVYVATLAFFTGISFHDMLVLRQVMYWGYYGRWGMGFGWILVIAFWVLIILGIVLFIRMIVRGDRNPVGEESALDILRKRYARGEISREEFEKIKDDIKRS